VRNNNKVLVSCVLGSHNVYGLCGCNRHHYSSDVVVLQSNIERNSDMFIQVKQSHCHNQNTWSSQK
jgi:hypothetical protein